MLLPLCSHVESKDCIRAYITAAFSALGLFFMATHQLMEMFPSGDVSTHVHTSTHTFKLFMFPLILFFLHSATCRNSSETNGTNPTDIDWYVSVQMLINCKRSVFIFCHAVTCRWTEV